MQIAELDTESALRDGTHCFSEHQGHLAPSVHRTGSSRDGEEAATRGGIMHALDPSGGSES